MKDIKSEKLKFYEKFVEERPTLGNQLTTKDADLVWEHVEGVLQEQREEMINNLREHKDWIWGYACRDCNGGGVGELPDSVCRECEGCGIINWDIEGYIEKYLNIKD